MTEKWPHKWKTTVSWVLEDPENVSGGGKFRLLTESAAPLNRPRISGWRWDGQLRRRRHLLLSASPTVCLMQTITLHGTENEEQNYNVVSGHFFVFWLPEADIWYQQNPPKHILMMFPSKLPYFQQISAYLQNILAWPEHGATQRQPCFHFLLTCDKITQQQQPLDAHYSLQALWMRPFYSNLDFNSQLRNSDLIGK